MNRALPAQRMLFALLMGSLVLVALVLRPLAVALFLAVVLAGALYPTYKRLGAVLRRPKIAAGVMTLGVFLMIVGPLFAFSAFLVKEATEATRFISETVRSEGVEGLVAKLPPPLENAARKALERIPFSPEEGMDATVQQQVSARGGQAAAAVGAAVAATGSLVFQTVMMLIALFFLLTNADAALRWVDDASPLRAGQTRELMAEFRKVSVAVMRSSFLTAGVQALAALGGYIVARVPHPLFFAGVTFFCALIPAIGAAGACLVAAALLLVTGHTVAAIFLAVWGVVVVGLADNVVKPLLIRGGVEMNGAVVFFSLIGGLAAFGTVGLLVGPLAVALFIATLRIYRRDYGDKGPPERPATQPDSQRAGPTFGSRPQQA
jgi:predicted PurR-regulated permease PerM